MASSRIKLAGSALAVICAGGLGGSSAFGAITPSTAPTVSVGVPFSITGTPDQPDLWRLDTIVRSGDKVQFAVDASAAESTMRLCLMGPTDDFGEDAEVDASCDNDVDPNISSGSLKRVTATYRRATGQPILRVSSLFDAATTYTITIERIIPKISLGTTIGSSVKRTFGYTLNGRLGDNTPVPDGTRATLKWRLAGTSAKPRSLAAVASVGGAFKFRATLPKRVIGKRVVLRACALGSDGAELKCLSKTVRVR